MYDDGRLDLAVGAMEEIRLITGDDRSSACDAGQQEIDIMISEEEVAQMREEEEARIVKAINQAVKSAGHLSNLLPTGTFLFFQFLLPLVSDGGNCSGRRAETTLTLLLLSACAVSCFLLSFTDTYKAPDGKLYHGIATPRGLWLPTAARPPAQCTTMTRYRVQALDFLHALLSVAVFAASALFTPNVTDCLLPDTIPSHLQNSLPVVVGFVASFVCILVPSRRRGFDQPLLERLADELE